MEDEKILNENISVADEEIEKVAGGSVPIFGHKVCDCCKQTFSSAFMSNYNGKTVCKDCKAKLEK